MLSPRWRKLLGDLRAARGRMVMITIAIAIGIFGVGMTLSAYTILTRETSRNYLAMNPASAVLEVDEASDSLVDAVRQRPGIAAAEAGSMVVARIETAPGEWTPLLLFVIRDFDELRIGRITPQAGSWPPPEGTILLEREALPLVKAKVGEKLIVQAPNGTKQGITISGVVHDPGVTPAWQEQMAYGYAVPATLTWLGESSTLHQLKVVVADQSPNGPSVERTVEGLAQWLRQQGHMVGEIRIPPGKHPHQTMMTSVLILLLLLSLMVLLLSSILTAALLGGLLVKQIRQIGIMKAIGARTWQITGLYLGLTALVGVIAVALGAPLGIAAGRGFAGMIAKLMNITLYSKSIPPSVYLVEVLAGVLLPLCIAAVTIMRTTRITVKEAITDFGISREAFGSRPLDAMLGKIRGLDRNLVLAVRNAFRRKGRLLLMLTLLAAAGGLFIASLNVKTAWEHYVADAASQRRYDLEIRLNRPEPENRILKALGGIPGVQRIEPWNLAPVAVSRPDGLEIVRTYPDGGHGSLTLQSVPEGSTMVQLPLVAGRWLREGETGSVVLNHMALASFPNIKVGDSISLTSSGRSFTLRVVGIVREILSPASAYVTPETFARTIDPAGYTNALRVVLNGHDASIRAGVMKEIEGALDRENISPKIVNSKTRLEVALNGHVYLFILPLMQISVLMVVVGGLGLMSAMGTSVVERTREIGVMRTIGGRSGIVLRNIMIEGIFIGLMSWVMAAVISVPLSWAIGRMLGMQAFRAPLPLVVSPAAIVIWLAVAVLGSAAASAYPAWKATQLTIRETLTYI